MIWLWSKKANLFGFVQQILRGRKENLDEKNVRKLFLEEECDHK